MTHLIVDSVECGARGKFKKVLDILKQICYIEYS